MDKDSKGRFTKGHSGTKPKGAVTKTSAKAKEIILAAIDKQSVDFDIVMGKLREEEPREWAKIMVKLMDFVLPKKIDLTSDDKPINNIPVATWAQDK